MPIALAGVEGKTMAHWTETKLQYAVNTRWGQIVVDLFSVAVQLRAALGGWVVEVLQ